MRKNVQDREPTKVERNLNGCASEQKNKASA